MPKDLNTLLVKAAHIRSDIETMQLNCDHTHTMMFESESVWVWCNDCGLFEDHELEERVYRLRIRKAIPSNYVAAKAALKVAKMLF